jgi:hypothetical protein
LKRFMNQPEHTPKCADGRIFKGFEQEIAPLFMVSTHLRNVANVADNLADKTKEESLDLARALLIEIPTGSVTKAY